MKVQHYVDRGREWLILNSLPDECQIIPKKGTSPTITGTGEVIQTAATPKVWRGQTLIPCLFYLARAFRPDMLPSQTVVTDEFNLELPYDAPIAEDDNVIILGKVYEVRRLKGQSQHDFTVEALIFYNTAVD